MPLHGWGLTVPLLCRDVSNPPKQITNQQGLILLRKAGLPVSGVVNQLTWKALQQGKV